LTLGEIRAGAHLADEKVDWFRVIVDLERQGYGATLVALSIATPKTTLAGLEAGEPATLRGGRPADRAVVPGDGKRSGNRPEGKPILLPRIAPDQPKETSHVP